MYADLVIIGCGLHSQMVPPSLQAYFKKHNIAYEAIDTVCTVSGLPAIYLIHPIFS